MTPGAWTPPTELSDADRRTVQVAVGLAAAALVALVVLRPADAAALSTQATSATETAMTIGTKIPEMRSARRWA